MLNEVDIHFRIPGLPHAVVKQADNYRLLDLVKKIETTLTDNLFNDIYNKTMPTFPKSEKPKKMIKDMCNVELFEYFEKESVTQCKECLFVLEFRHHLLHLRASCERK